MTSSSSLTALRETLYVVVFEADTPAGLAYDVALLVFIFGSVASTMLQTVHTYHSRHPAAFEMAERVFTGTFAADYALRAYVARPNARAYCCSFFGVVDLAALLPTLVDELTAVQINGGQMRLVRVLRLLRVFRVLHFAGLSAEAEALLHAFWVTRRKIIVFLLFILIMVTIMGTLMYIIEDNQHSGFTSIPRSIYWAIVTVTTVGYGDIAPQSVPGQALASMMMVLGYSLLAVPTGIAAAEYSLSSSGGGTMANGGSRGGCRVVPTPRVRRLGSKERLSTAVRACENCEAVDHDADALFCKHCGEALV